MKRYGPVVLLLALNACSAKQETRTADSRPRECTNPVLVVDNSAQDVARVYSGGTLIAEVGPGTHTIALRNKSRSRNSYRVVTSSPRSDGKVQVYESCGS
jgi:hypothetical protein